MSVEDLNVIDSISVDKEGNAVLTVSDHLEWDEANTHLLILQNKLNAYIDAIENESLYQSYPDAKGRKIVINLVAKYFPNKTGELFLRRTTESLESAGYTFKFKNLIK